MCIDYWKQQIDTHTKKEQERERERTRSNRTSSPIEFSLALLYSVACSEVFVVWIFWVRVESRCFPEAFFIFVSRKFLFACVHFGFRIRVRAFVAVLVFIFPHSFFGNFLLHRISLCFIELCDGNLNSGHIFSFCRKQILFFSSFIPVFSAYLLCRNGTWKCAMACRHIAFLLARFLRLCHYFNFCACEFVVCEQYSFSTCPLLFFSICFKISIYF